MFSQERGTARCYRNSAAVTVTSDDSVHMAAASNDDSTIEPSPVRSRWKRADAIPNALYMAPV